MHFDLSYIGKYLPCQKFEWWQLSVGRLGADDEKEMQIQNDQKRNIIWGCFSKRLSCPPQLIHHQMFCTGSSLKSHPIVKQWYDFQLKCIPALTRYPWQLLTSAGSIHCNFSLQA